MIDIAERVNNLINAGYERKQAEAIIALFIAAQKPSFTRRNWVDLLLALGVPENEVLTMVEIATEVFTSSRVGSIRSSIKSAA